MTDPVVSKWKQKGKIFLWTYLENKKNYPGWHFSTNSDGAESLLQLVDKMTNAKWPASKDILISKPIHSVLKRPNNKNGRARFRSPEVFRLKYSQNNVPESYWTLDDSERIVVLIVGLNKLNEFAVGIKNILKHHGDYAIGPDSGPCHNDQCFWFW